MEAAGRRVGEIAKNSTPIKFRRSSWKPNGGTSPTPSSRRTRSRRKDPRPVVMLLHHHICRFSSFMSRRIALNCADGAFSRFVHSGDSQLRVHSLSGSRINFSSGFAAADNDHLRRRNHRLLHQMNPRLSLPTRPTSQRSIGSLVGPSAATSTSLGSDRDHRVHMRIRAFHSSGWSAGPTWAPADEVARHHLHEVLIAR